MAPPADQPAIEREQAEVLHDEIERLPGTFRLPVVLCYFEGLSPDEAAARQRDETAARQQELTTAQGECATMHEQIQTLQQAASEAAAHHSEEAARLNEQVRTLRQEAEEANAHHREEVEGLPAH